jgi:hypothetical protein
MHPRDKQLLSPKYKAQWRFPSPGWCRNRIVPARNVGYARYRVNMDDMIE